MATPIPAKLRSADISRFVLRASQLEKVKPVIAYWCNYWILKQIIEKGLQNADTECLQYTTNLMDKIEASKTENSDNDAVTDDVAAKAYVENFGLETFQRADNAVRANKASKQTADTFLAAATFLDLCQIWGDLDPEIAARIKFAKYHSLRIAKALKAGEDPNLSNPVQEPAASEPTPALDPYDPEVQALNEKPEAAHPEGPSRQPSVVEVPDETDNAQRRMAQKSVLDESLHPSRSGSVPRPPQHQAPTEDFYQSAPPKSPVSPLAPSMHRAGSAGGGYFPETSGGPPTPPDILPPAPSNYASYPPPPIIPDVPSMPPGSDLRQPPQAPQSPDNVISPISPPTSYSSQPPAFPSPQAYLQPQPPIPGPYPPPTQPAIQPPPPNASYPPPVTHRPAPQQHVQPIAQASPPVQPPANAIVDEEAVAKAQKHARWAISALNFEDVPTAIRELQGALRTLGAS